MVLVDMESIESQKENIEPVRGGRSASALVKAFQGGPVDRAGQNEAAQERFEAELAGAADLDDPLEVWIRYIDWTSAAYPAGHSAHGGLVDLLERCARQFVRTAHYANDPRYLRVWVDYARHADDPRELFCFLARNGIGQGLATFYEEYAALLESRGRKGQADELYQIGLAAGARPVNRLRRRYEEFSARLERDPPAADEPSSPPIAPVRPALTTKFGGLALGDVAQQRGGAGSASHASVSASSKPRMQVFVDAPEQRPLDGSAGAGGWGSIGGLRARKKENTVEVRSMAGEKLPQAGATATAAAPKLQIFQDVAKSAAAAPAAANGKRRERVACDLEALYPEEGVEFSLEELKAKRMGLLDFSWPVEEDVEVDAPSQGATTAPDDVPASADAAQPVQQRQEDVYVSVMDTDTPLKDSPKPRMKRTTIASPTINTKNAMNDILDLFSQPLKCEQSDSDSDSNSDSDADDEDGADSTYALTQEVATSECQSDFTAGDGEHESDEELQNADSSQGPAALATVAAGDGRSDDNSDPSDEDEDDDNDDFRQASPPVEPEVREPVNVLSAVPATPQQQQLPDLRRGGLNLMTPITEDTETLASIARGRAAPLTIYEEECDGDDDEDDDDVRQGEPYSSPFIEDVPPRPPLADTSLAPPKRPALHERARQPLPVGKPVSVKPLPTRTSIVTSGGGGSIGGGGPVIAEKLCNPLDQAIRATILAAARPSVDRYPGCRVHDGQQYGARYDAIDRFAKATQTDGVSPAAAATSANSAHDSGTQYVVELDSRHALRRKLGEGAFAPVFLIENLSLADADGGRNSVQASSSSRGRRRLEALKVERPADMWEFYILRQIATRLGSNERAARSVVRAPEYARWDDCGLLVLEYGELGTVLDLVNAVKGAESEHGYTMTTGADVGVDETLALWLTAELCRTVEALHAAGIIHGDLKADNVLVRLSQPPPPPHGHAHDPAARYESGGGHGWSARGVLLCDFGRAIDMRAFGADVQFLCDWPTDAGDCVEMRSCRPWSYQADFHGLANVAHTLLFGRFVETATVNDDPTGGPRQLLKAHLKRYWQQELWNDLFGLLLNPAVAIRQQQRQEQQQLPTLSGGAPEPPLPGESMRIATKLLRGVRERIERWLDANSERKSPGLRATLRKCEHDLLAARR